MLADAFEDSLRPAAAVTASGGSGSTGVGLILMVCFFLFSVVKLFKVFEWWRIAAPLAVG